MHVETNPYPRRRILLISTSILGAFFAAIVGIVRNWSVAENPPCLQFLDEGERAALAGGALGAPEVQATETSCVADWGTLQVQMRRIGANDDDYDRRAEAWRGDPGFVALRIVEGLGAAARMGVIDQVVMGGHARVVRLVVDRPAGWLEVAVVHHWPAGATAPVATADIEARLVEGVRRHLDASTAFYVQR